MSDKFRIDITNIEREADSMDSVCRDIRQIGDSVRMMSDVLCLEGNNAETIKRKLRKMQNDIIKEAVKVDTLQGALRVVANNYKAAENNVAGHVGIAANWHADMASKIKKADTSIWEWVKEKLDNLIKAIGIKKPKKPTGKVTSEQERAHDKYLQSEAARLQAKYSKSWNSATPKEREKILKKYIEEFSAILGVKVHTMGWSTEKPDKNGYITNGSYNDSLRNVWMNKYVIENSSAKDVFSTVTHELRHAYQHNVIEHPENYNVTEETRERWKRSFDNYRTPEGFMRKYNVSEDEAFEMYRDQAVEVDARRFAGQN